MKSAVESLEDNKVKVSVEVDETEFDKAMDAAFRRISARCASPASVPARHPVASSKRGIGTSAAREEALREALPEYYAKRSARTTST